MSLPRVTYVGGPTALLVPVHCEGWEHFSESRSEIERAFAAAGLAGRLRWPAPGAPTEIATPTKGDRRCGS